jgi:hypothetical protein
MSGAPVVGLHLNRRSPRSTGRQLSLGDDHPQEALHPPRKADCRWKFWMTKLTVKLVHDLSATITVPKSWIPWERSLRFKYSPTGDFTNYLVQLCARYLAHLMIGVLSLIGRWESAKAEKRNPGNHLLG